MTDTANLALPCIGGSQAQKHVTHNEALRLLDTLVQLAVLDRDLTAPPGAPVEGQRWIVKPGATGAWASHVDAIAAWQDGAWQFSTPRIGWLAYVIDESLLLAWNGSAWVDAIGALSPTALNNIALLGVGTTADAANPLSAKLNNTLFVARTVAEGGDGHLRYKLSKESAAKTLSFLFQDNYSGRAEIGLIGDDDFRFKVSADGSTWHDGIVIAAGTGAVTLPNTTAPAHREMLTADRTYYVRTDGSDTNSGLANTSGAAFLTLQKAIDVTASLDLSINNVTIQAGTSASWTGAVLKSCLGAGVVTIVGDETTPANCTVTSAGFSGQRCNGQYNIRGFKFSNCGLVASSGTFLTFQNIEFAAFAGGAHMFTQLAGSILASGNYSISGAAAWHWRATIGGRILVQSTTVTLSGTPAFSSAFAEANQASIIRCNGNTFSGTATGKRYNADGNSIISSNGTTLPGSIAGTTTPDQEYS